MAPSDLALNDFSSNISLNGAWDFAMGNSRQWNEIQVPGAWEAQGYDRRFEGPARYRRQVTIPGEWTGSSIVLEFGAVSYACRVIVNGTQVGEHQGMWTPFAFDITSMVRPGSSNLIEVEVFKPSHLPGARFPFRTSLVGFIPDLGTTFGGLWQDVSLRAFRAWFEELRLVVDYDTQDLICSFRTNSIPGQDIHGALIEMSVTVAGQKVASCTVQHNTSGSNEIRCHVPQPARWRPEKPVLYDVVLSLRLNGNLLATTHRRTGFRRLSASGETLLFNDQPIILRGVLHWGWNPESIAPFFQVEAARAEIRKVKRLGFNLIKLCLFVPNPAFYDIADEEGIFLWQEWPMWLPQVDSSYVARATGEYAEYMKLACDHPSIVLYSAGCELDESVGADLLGSLNKIMRAGAAGALFCDNSGMGEAYGGLHVDFSDFSDYHTYSDLDFFEDMLDHWRRDWKPPRPLIFGEFCDSDTYRDPDEIKAGCSGQVPWWLTQDNPLMDWRPEAHPVLNQPGRMQAANLDLNPPQLKQISYDGSLAIRKYVLELIRRRAGIGGYVITVMRDTPITTSGIFDDFGNPKWDADQFLSFNSENVLCLDGDRRRRWQYGGDRVDRFDFLNVWAGERVNRRLIFNGPGTIFRGEARLSWRLTNAVGEVCAGDQAQVRVDLDGMRPREITAISFQLPQIDFPQELRLEAEFSIPAVHARNTWSIWSYPKREYKHLRQAGASALYDPGFLLTELEQMLSLERLEYQLPPLGSRLVIASALPAWTEDFLKPGGRMLLLQWSDGPLPAFRRPFWREAIRIFAPHPLWDRFGAGGDLRFLALSSDTSIDLSRLGEVLPALDEVRPIFRRLDARNFQVSEYLLEAALGEGLLMICTLRLAGGHGRQPSGLRRNIAGQALLWSMLDYLEEEL